MLNSLPAALLVGTLLGFLAGLGVGGGSLLILWLTVVLDVQYPVARSINLLFFLPAALIASFFRCRQGGLSWKRLLPGIAGGCLSTLLFFRLGLVLDLQMLKKGFGLLLLLTGLRELFYRPRPR